MSCGGVREASLIYYFGGGGLTRRPFTTCIDAHIVILRVLVRVLRLLLRCREETHAYFTLRLKRLILGPLW